MATENWRKSERARQFETWKREVNANRLFWEPLIEAAEKTGLWRLEVHDEEAIGKDPDTNEPVQLANRVNYIEFFIGDEKVGQVRETRHGGGWSYRGERRFRISGPHVPAARYKRYSWGDEHRDYKKVDSAIKSMKEWFRAKNPKEILKANWETDQKQKELSANLYRTEREKDDAFRWFRYKGAEIAVHVLYNDKLDDITLAKTREYLDAKLAHQTAQEALDDYQRRFEAQYWDFHNNGSAKNITEY